MPDSQYFSSYPLNNVPLLPYNRLYWSSGMLECWRNLMRRSS